MDGRDTKPLLTKAEPLQSSRLQSNAPQLPVGGSPNPAEYARKVHHRIVFTEVGTTISEVETLSEALFATSDAVKGE